MKPLTLIMSLPGYEPNPAQTRLTKKLLEGVSEYAKYWPGKVALILPKGEVNSGNLDDIITEKSSLSFSVEVLDFSTSDLRKKVADSGLVLCGSHPSASGLAEHCKLQRIPYIHVAELTLKTRLQILKSEVKNPLNLLKKIIWEIREEHRTINKIKHASGIQCNGTPTYKSYKSHNKEALLYFDNRIYPNMLSSTEKIANKYAFRTPKSPLQLAFSGRLNRIKGAQYLIPIAKELRRRNFQFHLHIFGDGELKKNIIKKIHLEKLQDNITYHGAVDFRESLIPFISNNIDIFLCTHTQGDPSCTYIETFACGVPILGFSNEALEGILEKYPCGWSTPIGNIEKIAMKLEALQNDISTVENCAKSALKFATENTFDITFSNRINHMIRLSQQFPAEK